MDNNLPTEFDLIVVGTGVVESIISAAASRIGKKVLHVDSKSYYGGHWASFNLEDFQNMKTAKILPFEENLRNIFEEKGEIFHAFGNELRNIHNFHTNWHLSDNHSSSNKPLQSHNEEAIGEEQLLGSIHEEREQMETSNIMTKEILMKDYRKFIIDLCPKLHFARGSFVELLISSNIARYSEFRSVTRVLTWINGNIEVVPCSRSDVFANNKVSVVEKRMLMKLLTSIEEDEKNLTVPAETTYKSLLKGKKLSDNIIHFVLYALSMSTDETLWLEGLKGTKRFLHSLGRFGKTPFLFSMYGSGEITQAFCRLSAVFGGIFALDQPLHGFLTDSENTVQSLLCGEQKIKATHFVMDVGMLPSKFLKNTEACMISRAVLITDKSLMDSDREHLTLLLYPLKNNRLCRILELGSSTGTCPKNLFLVHLTTSGTSIPKEDLQDCIDNLFTLSNDTDNPHGKPQILWSSYFSIPDTNEQRFADSIPKNLFICPGPDQDLDYDFSVNKAKEIFSSIYPNEDFLPRAPDADEIVIEGELATESEAEVSSLNDTLTVPEEGIEQKLETFNFTEVAVEAKASSSPDNEYEEFEVEGCSEVKEVTT